MVVGLRLEELARLPVAADAHPLELDVLEPVECNRAHEAQVCAQTTMLARALQTYKNAICDAYPLRSVCAAFEAELFYFYVRKMFCLTLNCLKQNNEL